VSAIIGTLFAGGRGRRLGNKDKARLRLAGRPLWKIAEERLLPVVDHLITTGPSRPDWLSDSRHIRFVQDALIEGEAIGPAGGLVAALKFASDHYGPDALILTIPVDAPFFPSDLVERMRTHIDGDHACAVAIGEDRPQPAFGIWKAHLFDHVYRLISEEIYALHAIAREAGARHVSFEDVDETFLNINTIDDLRRADAMAELWFARHSMNFTGNQRLGETQREKGEEE
jgi:molybdopterin-guanine dinucleotide biosynthesis protein A